VKELRDLVRTIANYPKPGVMFRDITTLLSNADGFRRTIQAMADRYTSHGIRKVAGIEARGFILGGAIAERLGAGFVPVRKKGKLPGQVLGHDYQLEYGTDRVEIHIDAIEKGEPVLLVDDLIATGGTAGAAIKLIEAIGGTVVEASFVIDLPELGGRRRLESGGHTVFALMEFEGE